MLGSIFCESQKEYFEMIPLSRGESDITSFPLVLNHISLHEPDFILNLATYTDVEKAEREGMLEAFRTNALGAQNVAQAASAFSIPLIFLSTDYVFDGEKD